MASEVAKVTSKGQVTIPQAVRERMGLRAGDAVVFRLEDGVDDAPDVTVAPPRGRVKARLRNIPDLLSLAGTMPPPRRRVRRSWAEIREAAWDSELRVRDERSR